MLQILPLWRTSGQVQIDPVESVRDLTPAHDVYNHMVYKLSGYAMSPSHDLDATFAALADPTRRAILARLASGDAPMTELAKPFTMSQPAISKHLKVLERAGLISRGRDAQRRPCRIEARPLAAVDGWLEGYRKIWQANFRRLDSLLDELVTHEQRRGHSKDSEQASAKQRRRR
jgi:DNA-binding transcriptional ArsR family regulator